jgi:hypothetical protein
VELIDKHMEQRNLHNSPPDSQLNQQKSMARIFLLKYRRAATATTTCPSDGATSNSSTGIDCNKFEENFS